MRPAIIVVDMLKDALHAKDPSLIEAYWNIVPRIKELLEKARSLDIPVVFACDSFLENDFIFKGKTAYCLRGTEGAEVIDELMARPAEILPKRRLSGFFKTDLDQTLRLLQVDTTVIVGINTQVCVLATAIDSVSHDFYTVVLSDCTASRQREAHLGALKLLNESGLYPLVRVMSSDEFLREMMGERKVNG